MPKYIELAIPEPMATAWNATLRPAIDLTVVTPLPFTYYFAAMNSSISFNDPADQMTALAHVYGIWSNAGNVSVRWQTK